MNMSSEKRIAEIRERCEKATPEPWEVDKYYHDEPYEEYIKTAAIIANDGENAYNVTRNDWSNPVEADLNFIAHAREDIPYLLEQLAESQRREQAAAESLKRKCEDERAAVKCICDIETYLELGSAKYIKRVIDDWRGIQEGVNQ